MTIFKEFLVDFNEFLLILISVIAILGLFSFIMVFAKKSLSAKERVYHHLIGTFNIVFFTVTSLSIILNCFYQKTNLDRLSIFISLALLICGILTNLITRNKI